MAEVRAAADRLRELVGAQTPAAFVVLGSGLGPAVEDIDAPRTLPFAELPGYASAGVVGHAGEFVAGRIAGKPVLVSRGRIHLYEGHDADTVVLPERAAALMGIPVMLATNAVGGLDPALAPGDVVLVADHINATGTSPLVGANLDDLGTRFPVMRGAYDAGLAAIAREAADAAGVQLTTGVLAAVLGPQYETPAEVAALRSLGADVVGMSTVPEVIAAVHAGMRVAALSLVTNSAGALHLGHEEVVDAAGRGAGAVASLVTGILSRL